MPVVKVVQMEERCDRCRALLAIYAKGGRGELIEQRAKGKGSFCVEANGKVLVKYSNICPACYSRLKRLVGEMGQIDRTRGGAKKSSSRKGKKNVRSSSK